MIYLKETTRHTVRDFAKNMINLKGSKLFALMRLIEAKGSAITTNNESLKGVKALEFSKGEYISIIKKPLGKCFKIKTLYLVNL